MVHRRRVPAGTTVSCARKVGKTSKDNKANARKAVKRDVLRRMVFLPEDSSDSGRTHRGLAPGRGNPRAI
jgi:hypothetical protein